MKKLFFALALSLVGLFFSNFIIPSAEHLEKTEVVNSMLPYQTISMINYNAEQPAVVEITMNGNLLASFTLALGESWNGSFVGNSINVKITTNQFPYSSQVSVPTSYKMFENASSIKPICTENYTFTANGTYQFNCFTSPNG